MFIEVHHIVPGGGDEENNAMPLCFDCHAKVSHYDAEQPLGTKFRPEELRRRRDQVYEACTRHLVPALDFRVAQGTRKLPDVGFEVTHLGDAPPARVRVTIDIYVDGKEKNLPGVDPLYRGGLLWNLNPKHGVNGHFEVVRAACRATADLRACVMLVVHDIYERMHPLLPVMYVFDRTRKEWWLDPVAPEALAERIRHGRRQKKSGKQECPTSRQ